MSNPLGIYGWAQQSLGQYALVNDFSTPLSTLTTAIVTLLTVIQGKGGSDPSPRLLPYIGAPSAPVPWGSRTAVQTNPFTDVPNTDQTRSYNLTISRGVVAPDGVNKSAILINGRFPGPLIEANWGDWIELNVRNNIAGPAEPTSIHAHGFRYKSAPWDDGTSGIAQCPIAPGSTYTYRFQADLYGSSWYHSHVSAQLLDGAWGPIVVYGPEDNKYDIDVGPVLAHDYYYLDYRSLVANSMSNNTLTALLNPSNNIFVHGTDYECDISNPQSSCKRNLGLAKWSFHSGKIHKMRIINPSSAASPLLFSIDNHTMAVVSNDFTPIKPYTTNVLSLSAGQRTDILVMGNGGSNSTYFIRVRLPSLCNYNMQSFGLGAIYYENAAATSVPSSLPHPDFMSQKLTTCANDPLNLTQPAYAIPVATNVSKTYQINLALTTNSTGHTLYTMNGKSYRADYNNPLIMLSTGNATANSSKPTANFPHYGPPTASSPTPSIAPLFDTNVYDLGPAGSVTRFIFNNSLAFAHPMHLHGWQFQVIAEGVGKWDGKVTNPLSPHRRDTQILQANGYMVADIISNNPGAWPFHCHIAWHLSAGMSITLVQQGLDKNELKHYFNANCQAFQAWQDSHNNGEIDSGL